MDNDRDKSPSADSNDGVSTDPNSLLPNTGETEDSDNILVPEANKGKKSRRFLFIYTLILFILAFLLILLSYFIQSRNSEAQLKTLKHEFSLSAKSATEKLWDENNELVNDIKELTGEITAIKSDLLAEQESNKKLADEIKSVSTQLYEQKAKQETLAKSNMAMSLLVELQSLTAAKQRTAARAVIDRFEGESLEQYLPETPATEGEPSPADIYQTIKKQLRR